VFPHEVAPRVTTLTIGTRRSALARWQADHVGRLLHAHHPGVEIRMRIIVTEGDRSLDKPLTEIGGKGVFTQELEAELLAGEIDLAVHSLKDLPTTLEPAFAIGAVPARGAVEDVLISRSGERLAELPEGATVGTSSLRRAAQLRSLRPDLRTESIRGNVPTRLEKALAAGGPYDAIVLARAGLERLELTRQATEVLDPLLMLPAPGQGALAVQCRACDRATLALLAPLDDRDTRWAVEAERAFLHALDSGCRLPVAALAIRSSEELTLTGRVLSLDGRQVITVEDRGAVAGVAESVRLGETLARRALDAGAAALLQELREQVP
jgi:hydroxymethylbilane synthase